MSEEQPPEPQPAAAGSRLARWAPGLLVIYGLGLWGLSHAQAPSATVAVALSVVSWLVFTGLLLLITAALTAARLPRPAVALTLAGGAALWYTLAYRLGPHPPPWAGIVATLCMIVAMSALGTVLSWLFGEASLLPPALALAGLVDVWGVNFGVVAKVAATSPETIAKASAALPAVASAAPTSFALTDLSIGPGDIAVAALVLAVVARHGFDRRRNLWWMYGLTIAGLAVVLAAGLNVPGLVFIGAAGIVANRSRFRYTPDERRSLAVALGLIVVFLAVLTVVMHRAG